ncbi:MAG: hypothetical protein ACK59A_12230 [Cyanobacteriota bacterium]
MLYPRTPLDDLLGTFRLVIVLLSATHALSPGWWVDEVKRLLIPAFERRLFWQQIEDFTVTDDLASITPLLWYGSQWSEKNLKRSTLEASKRIKAEWEQTPTFSHSLPTPPATPSQAADAPEPGLPISHVALVIQPTLEVVQSKPRYTFSLYHRHHDDEHYNLLPHHGEARGSYPFPWASGATASREPQAQASLDEDPPREDHQPLMEPQVCPVLLRLLEWAQRQDSEFILEIFAPHALLHLNWGDLLAPPTQELEPLVQAHPFLLRSSDRLGKDYQSKAQRLRQKWEQLKSPNSSWSWVDGDTFQPMDWSKVLSAPRQVAIQRSTPLAEHGRKDWLRAVVRSMVPLALWPHPSTPPTSPKDTPNAATVASHSEDPHTKVLALCQQALQGCPPQSGSQEPDLDQLAQLRFANQAEDLKHYAILVDHPSRRPLLDDADPFQSSPPPNDLLISC